MSGARPAVLAERGWLLAALAWTALLAVLIWPLLSGQVEPKWDARDYFYPALTYQADAFAEGRLPLWDPYTNCGQPFFSEPQHAVFSPLTAAAGAMFDDSGLAFAAYWAFLWWWAGLGMLYAARHFGAGPAGGLLAAASYALSGFFVGGAQSTVQICLASWLPWIFALADRAVERSNPGYAVLAGLALGLSTQGGYPGLVVFVGPALTFWLVLRVVFRDGGETPERRRKGLHVLSTLALVAAVSVAIWSPVLHGFFSEGAGFTERTRPVAWERSVDEGNFTLPSFFSVLYPYATIPGWPSRELMGNDISMTNVYAGVLAFPLAAFWFLRGGGRRRPWWILAFVAFALLVTLGAKGGVRIALTYLYPPLRYVKANSIFRVFWIFPLSLAAGLGYSRLRENADEVPFALGIFGVWTTVAVATAGGLAGFFGYHGVAAASSIRTFLPAAIVLPGALAALGAVALGATRRDVDIRRAAAALLVLFLADMAGHLHNNSFTVWNPTDIFRRAEAHRRRTTLVAGEVGPRLPPFAFGFFNAQQIFKTPVVQGYVAQHTEGFENVLCKSRYVEVMASPLRFWLSPGAERTPPDATALATLSGVGAMDPVPAFVDDPPSALPPVRAVPGSYGTTRVLSYAPENVEVEVDAPGPGGGLLASTERFATGWRAMLDGGPAPVLKVNLYFRGIFVPPGRHRVVWAYDPPHLTAFLFLSGSSVVLSGIAAAFLLRRRRGGKPDGAADEAGEDGRGENRRRPSR